MAFRIPEFNPTEEITYNVHVTKHLGKYNVVLGQNFLHIMGINLKFCKGTIQWQDIEIDMKDPTCTKYERFYMREESFVSEETDQTSKILDAKYQADDLQKTTDKLVHLDDNQKSQLRGTISKHSSLFDGTLSQWKGFTYKIELKENSEPFHVILQAYEQTFINKFQRLCDVEVLQSPSGQHQ